MSASAFTPEEIAAAKAWPFEQARALRKRLEIFEKRGKPKEGPVVFETGYGPSGLPHIGTFGEVVRTTMVRNAFRLLTDDRIETRLICVSDDMDGMRKVPPTVPNPEKLEPFLQKPLTDVPDPFGTHENYGAHMNARLCAFLDSFGFDYEFVSATALYKSGRYDEMLRRALANYDKIMDVMLPTLGEERRATYSPFLPISPRTGRVLYVPMKATDPDAGTITFDDEDGAETELPVTGGQVKLQWKPDFGMRWAALGVDFEMFGKDHDPNAPLYSRICKILGAEPPVQYVYELFLDEKGEKISKSKGNGISVEEWLTYASQESLSLFQFQKPRVAKKLYFDVIPKAVDEYWTFVDKYHQQEGKARLDNPAWHIHQGAPPAATPPVTFAMLLNLVSAAGDADPDLLRGFIKKYRPDASDEELAAADGMIAYAGRYFDDFIKPTKQFRTPSDKERAALEFLSARLKALGDGETEDAYQTAIFDAGKAQAYENIREWFTGFYEVVFGQSEGPRLGPFAKIYGALATAQMIDDALARA